MKKLLFLSLIPLALLTACQSKQPADNRQVITVSILPLQYFARELSGDRFRINVLVPPGASHHNYDPTPRQLQDLEKSAVLFVNGHLGFEKAWIPKLQSNYPKLPIVDLSAGVSLITAEGGEGEHSGEQVHQEGEDEHGHEGVDPHYWMSFTEARKIAGTLAAGLIAADPACRELVEKNLVSLERKIDSVAREAEPALRALNHKSFMIFHPALAYFARDFGLTQHSMEKAGKEPTALYFRQLVDISRIQKINTIFIQKEYDQENAQTFARETRSKIIVIDPMSPDWLTQMEEIVGRMKEMDSMMR